jgi:hypothetical protein
MPYRHQYNDMKMPVETARISAGLRDSLIGLLVNPDNHPVFIGSFRYYAPTNYMEPPVLYLLSSFLCWLTNAKDGV